MASEMASARQPHFAHACASMRPRRDGLGNPRLGEVSDRVADASMRPRRDGLGNQQNRADQDREGGASMRPRRDGLGNTAQRGIDFTRLAGFNEAEARWPRKWGLRRRNPSGSPPLQ